MPFEPLIQPEAPPPAPDPLDERLKQMETNLQAQINAAYQANKGIAPPPPQPQVQYVPYPYAPQAEEQEMSEADILADLPGAVTTLAERIAAEKEQALREEFGQHLGRFYEKDYERDIQALSAQPHYKFVEKELKDYFAQNPQEKYQPGRLMEKYNSLAYSKLDEIRAAERAEAEANEPARLRTVEPSIPISSAASAPRAVKEEVRLSEEEERARVKSNRLYGVNMSPEEWAGVRDGKLLPMDYHDSEDD